MKVYWKFEKMNNLKFTLGSIRTIDQVSHNSIVQFCKHWEESFTVTLGTIKKCKKYAQIQRRVLEKPANIMD